jgi:hypothetical protein
MPTAPAALRKAPGVLAESHRILEHAARLFGGERNGRVVVGELAGALETGEEAVV